MAEELLHSPECRGREEDVAMMRARYQKVMEAGEFFEDYVSNEEFKRMTSSGHYRCLEFIICQSLYPHEMDAQYFYYSWLKKAMESDCTQTVILVINQMCHVKLLRHVHVDLKDTISFLKMAVCKNAVNVVKHFLKDVGATQEPPHIEIIFPGNACILAIQKKRLECLRLLLRHGALLDVRHLRQACLLSPKSEELHEDAKKHTFGDVYEKFTFPSPEVDDYLSLAHHFACSVTNDVNSEKKLLDILYHFGVNLWHRDTKGRLPVDVVQNETGPRKWPLGRVLWKHLFFGPVGPVPLLETQEVVCEHMRQLMGRPLSLQDQCRLVVTRSMGLNYVDRMEQTLPYLPPLILSFLRFDDLKQDPVPVTDCIMDSSAEELSD